MFHLLEAVGIIVNCALPAIKSAPTAPPDFTSNPLVDIIAAGFIGAVAPLVILYFTLKQQSKRDKVAYRQQIDREQVAYERQIERERIAFEQQLKREQIAYERAVKDAKRERLRSSYRVIRNAADRFQIEVQQLSHVASLANISLTGVDEAIIEITLEDVGNDVVTIFSDMRGAFNEFSARWHMPEEGSWEEVLKRKETVFEKIEELTAAMQKHLKELES